jgi:hypothetical protein
VRAHGRVVEVPEAGSCDHVCRVHDDDDDLDEPAPAPVTCTEAPP